MKVLTSEQMAKVDIATFEEVGVASIAVMESAGRAVADQLLRQYAHWLTAHVFVFVGAGNNGGDGFVIARTLKNIGVNTFVIASRPVSELKGDARKMAIAWNSFGGETVELSPETIDDFFADVRTHSCGLFVDCILGLGAKGPAYGFAAKLITEINVLSRNAAIPVVSVDLPSGVDASTGRAEGACIHADVTFTLQSPKLGNVLFPGSRYCGDLYVLDIGISNIFLEEGAVVGELLDKHYVKSLLSDTHNPVPDFHKGGRGHVAVVGGSRGKLGAAKLAGYGALRSGAGLVTLYLPFSVAEAASTSVIELMCETLPEEDGSFAQVSEFDLEGILGSRDAIVIGPGMGVSPGAIDLLKSVLNLAGRANLPLVIDADGLNILAANKELFNVVPTSSVLTPHSGEMARLLGTSVAQIEKDRIAAVKSLSVQTGCWIVLKGARTIVSSSQGELFFNPAATEALATAGSGDVLSGIIGAFLARGRSVCSAVLSAVFLHGLAGITLEEKKSGPYGTLASEIAEVVPQLLNEILQLAPSSPSLSRKLW